MTSDLLSSLASRLVPAADGVVLDVLGERTRCIATRDHTAGAFSLLEITSRPHAGPPLHWHRREEECFYVCEGTFRLQIGENTSTIRAGDFALLPRGVVHTYKNAEDTPGRLLVLVTPSGIEDFFAEVDGLPPPADPERLTAVAARYGIEIVGPPL